MLQLQTFLLCVFVFCCESTGRAFAHSLCACLVVWVCGFEFARTVRSSVCMCVVIGVARDVFCGECAHWLRVHDMFCLCTSCDCFRICHVWCEHMTCHVYFYVPCALLSIVFNPVLCVTWLLVQLPHLLSLITLLVCSSSYVCSVHASLLSTITVFLSCFTPCLVVLCSVFFSYGVVCLFVFFA